jgi:DNA-binding response OmpR family regulator
MTGANVILIVEEDVLVRHPLAEYLRECGYKVAEAVDADEARQLLVRGPGGIDMVLVHATAETDRSFTFASWVRGKYPEIQVILAGTLTKATEKAASLCEDGPALTKPYDHKLVLAHIRRLRAARDRSKGE